MSAAPSCTTCAACAARQLASARSATTNIATGEDAPAGAGPSAGRRAWGFTKEVLIVVVSALVLSFLIKTFFFQSFWIPSGSMEPTLIYGDRILVTKWRPDPQPLRRGDIIVFKDPGNWLPADDAPSSGLKTVGKDILTFTGLLPEDAGEHLVKRIVGLGGDHVECADPDGKVEVNGEEITEDYILAGTRPCGTTFSVTVPEGYLWVMGDNRDNSA